MSDDPVGDLVRQVRVEGGDVLVAPDGGVVIDVPQGGLNPALRKLVRTYDLSVRAWLLAEQAVAEASRNLYTGPEPEPGWEPIVSLDDVAPPD
jgi:hypothetical protein